MPRYRHFIAMALMASSVFAQDSRPAAETASVRFKKAMPGVGDRATLTMKMDMSVGIDVLAGGQVIQSFKQIERKSEDTKIEILAVGKVGVTKIEKAYGDVKKASGTEGALSEEASPAANRTFIAELKDGEVHVSDPEGGELAPEVRDAVLEDYDEGDEHENGLVDMGQKFGELIPRDRPIKVGETVQVDAAKAKEILGDDDLEVQTARMTLKETRRMGGRLCGVFDVSMKVEGDSGAEEGQDMKMVMDLGGELVLGIDDLWVNRFKLEGPIKITGAVATPNGTVQMLGTGRMMMDGRAEYVVKKG